MTAAKISTVNSSRSGSRNESTNAGSDPVTRKAFCGHPASQLVNGLGTGKPSVRSADGRYRITTSAIPAAISRRSTRSVSRPEGNARIR